MPGLWKNMFFFLLHGNTSATHHDKRRSIFSPKNGFSAHPRPRIHHPDLNLPDFFPFPEFGLEIDGDIFAPLSIQFEKFKKHISDMEFTRTAQKSYTT